MADEEKNGTRSDRNDDDDSFKNFAREKLEGTARLFILLLGDSLLFVVWQGLSFVLHLFAEWTEKHGPHERCAFLLREVAPWFFFAIALLHLISDVNVEIRNFLRKNRGPKSGKKT